MSGAQKTEALITTKEKLNHAQEDYMQKYETMQEFHEDNDGHTFRALLPSM